MAKKKKEKKTDFSFLSKPFKIPTTTHEKPLKKRKAKKKTKK